jgi:uncharacterized protein (DUF1778 family)
MQIANQRQPKDTERVAKEVQLAVRMTTDFRDALKRAADATGRTMDAFMKR